MSEEYLADVNAAAAMAAIGFRLVYIHEVEKKVYNYFFYFEEQYETVFHTCMDAYFEGTLKVNAKEFAYQLKKLTKRKNIKRLLAAS